MKIETSGEVVPTAKEYRAWCNPNLCEIFECEVGPVAPQARPMGLPSVTQGALCCKFRKIHFDPSNHVEVTRKARREAMVSLTPSPEAGITYNLGWQCWTDPDSEKNPPMHFSGGDEFNEISLSLTRFSIRT